MEKANFKVKNPSYLLSLLVIGSSGMGVIWLVSKIIADGLIPLASGISAVFVFVVMVYLRPKFTPYKWLAFGIAVTALFTLYPILYTLYLSVTNMGSGHLMSKAQAIEHLETKVTYLPDDGQNYQWVGYESSAGDFALWLIAEDGTGWLALPDTPLEMVAVGEHGVGELDENGFPLTIDGYMRLDVKQTALKSKTIEPIEFGIAPNSVRIRSIKQAATLQPKYKYDEELDAVIDQETGIAYRPIEGTFTAETGEELTPGFIVYIGLHHYERFLGNKGFREPLGRILVWNIAFAFMSVFVSFIVGLIVTILFDDLPGRQVIRALLIIPWPIPVLVSILIWRSMLNPDLGFVAPMLETFFGSSPAWFQDPNWTRVAVILVNVWLSYPYFYVISAGAIRSIPTEIYDAAIVDGAGWWAKFYHITLPLLLRILTPLLIASFTFNFNNFNVIYIFNYGNPPMANTIVPMGHTDILISFIYRLAFTSTNVSNYGLAAAITVMLFVLVSMMVMFQMRFTKLFQDIE